MNGNPNIGRQWRSVSPPAPAPAARGRRTVSVTPPGRTPPQQQEDRTRFTSDSDSHYTKGSDGRWSRVKNDTNMLWRNDLGAQDHIFDHTVWMHNDDVTAVNLAEENLPKEQWNRPDGLYGIKVETGPNYDPKKFGALKSSGMGFLDRLSAAGGSHRIYKPKVHTEPEIGLATFEHDAHDNPAPRRPHPGTQVVAWGHVSPSEVRRLRQQRG